MQSHRFIISYVSHEEYHSSSPKLIAHDNNLHILYDHRKS